MTEFLENSESGVRDRVGTFGVYCTIGLQNAAELGLIKGKGFRVPAAYTPNQTFLESPHPGLFNTNLLSARQ